MIDLQFIGGTEVMARLDRIDPKLRDELKVGIGRLAIKLQTKVVTEKLSGQVLKRRSGKLRGSIKQIVEVSGTSVSGIVSTPVEYAPPHEYGFHGTVSVKESLRTIKQAFGRSITPTQVTVRAHSMKMNLPERSFLRSALREMQVSGAIAEEINADIARAVA